MPILPPLFDPPAMPARAGGREPRYGADVSSFLPASGKVRRLFGGDWFGVGPAFSPVRIAAGTAFRPDFDLLTSSRRGDDALVAFAGGEVVRRLSAPTGYFTPYAGLGAGLTYIHVDADSIGVEFGTVSVSGSAFVGTRLGRNAYFEARYRFVPSLEGLNFSGTSLTLGLRF